MQSINHNHYQMNRSANIRLQIGTAWVKGTVEDLFSILSSDGSQLLNTIGLEQDTIGSGEDIEVSTKLTAPTGTVAYIGFDNPSESTSFLTVQKTSNPNTKIEQRTGQFNGMTYHYVMTFAA